MFEVGRVCMKIAGRDANCYCVVLAKVDDIFVLVDGQTRRKNVNIKHLEPTKTMLDIKEGADHSVVVEAFSKIGIEIAMKKSKPATKRQKKQKVNKKESAPKKEKKGSKPKKEAKKETKKAPVKKVEDKTSADEKKPAAKVSEKSEKPKKAPAKKPAEKPAESPAEE